MGRKKSKPKGKYKYEVKRKTQGGRTERTMKGGSFTSKKEAEAFYRKHSRATRIQRVVRKSGLTAGSSQPDAPKRIKRGKTIYKRAYQGPHTKRDAQMFVKGFRKDGIKATTKRTKRGSYVYYAA